MDRDAWDRTQREIVRRHRHARQLEREVQLVLVFAAVRVVVRVCPAAPNGVTILAEVGDVHAMEPVTALRLNATLARGAVVLLGSTYAVRLCTRELDGDALEQDLQRIAGLAATIKAGLRRSCDGEVFRNYVE